MQLNSDNDVFKNAKLPMEELWMVFIREREVPSLIEEAKKA